MSKSKSKQFPPEWSDQSYGDHYNRTFKSMVLSPSYLQLTPRSKNLLNMCGIEQFNLKCDPTVESKYKDDLRRYFYFNQHLWRDVYKLYRKGDDFHYDMALLISYGFIRCDFRGKASRDKNIYQYWDMWRKYGKETFRITKNDCTESLVHHWERIGIDEIRVMPPEDYKKAIRSKNRSSAEKFTSTSTLQRTYEEKLQ